ncbi:hypothetical protein, partial [Acinetobacter lactucae]
NREVMITMYTCSYDDELADIVKAAAKRENRTHRGQFHHYLKLILQHEGLLESPDNKKADCTRQSNQSASV